MRRDEWEGKECLCVRKRLTLFGRIVRQREVCTRIPFPYVPSPVTFPGSCVTQCRSPKGMCSDAKQWAMLQYFPPKIKGRTCFYRGKGKKETGPGKESHKNGKKLGKEHVHENCNQSSDAIRRFEPLYLQPETPFCRPFLREVTLLSAFLFESLSFPPFLPPFSRKAMKTRPHKWTKEVWRLTADTFFTILSLHTNFPGSKIHSFLLMNITVTFRACLLNWFHRKYRSIPESFLMWELPKNFHKRSPGL